MNLLFFFHKLIFHCAVVLFTDKIKNKNNDDFIIF